MKYKIVIEKPAEKFIVKLPRLPCPNTTEMAGVFCTPNTMWGPANADPHRGTLSFVTQSSFVLVRSTTEGIAVTYPFSLSHRMGCAVTRSLSVYRHPINTPGYGAAGVIISFVSIKPPAQ